MKSNLRLMKLTLLGACLERTAQSVKHRVVDRRWLGQLPEVIRRVDVVLETAKHARIVLRAGAVRSLWSGAWSSLTSGRLQTGSSLVLARAPIIL